MLRRLYFILPTPAAVKTLVGELRQAGIESRHLSVASRHGAPLLSLGIRLQDDIFDRGARIERVLWMLNLLLFALALVMTVALLFIDGVRPLLAVPLLIMALCFAAGLRFTHLPNAHLADFSDALRHGELVLMTDVPPRRVAEIESLVQRHHPAAAVGGVGWSSDLLHT